MWNSDMTAGYPVTKMNLYFMSTLAIRIYMCGGGGGGGGVRMGVNGAEHHV